MSWLVCDDPMTAVSFRTAANRAAVVALAVTAGSVALGEPARADQTVVFDEAGAGAPRISLVGDSTLTAVRWYADYGALRRYNFVLSAESCRRTIEQSCISREGYRAANVIGAMQSLGGDLGDVLVVMSGYNDPVWTIDEAIEGVVDEARRQGVEHVVWLTLRTSDDVNYSDPQQQSSINTFREYNAQLVDAAEASDGFLQIADWATYSNGASSWFSYDGVHLTPEGVDAATGYIAAIVDRVLAGEDVSPASAPWTVLVPGAEGDVVGDVQEALIAAGIEVPGGADRVYGNDTMVAVAAYQRQHGELQVTGAVDVATARALGVYEDPDAADEVAATTEAPTTAPPTTEPAPAPAPPAAIAVSPDPAAAGADGAANDAGDASGVADARGGGALRWLLVAAIAVVALAGAIAGRRSYVVARRKGRRWARTHPATSPHRSVADERRNGDLPPAARIYDHELEDVAERARQVAGSSSPAEGSATHHESVD